VNDGDKAKLYRQIVQRSPDWWVLERMRLHGFWPQDKGLPQDPPEEAAERQRIETELAELRGRHAILEDPEAALKEERQRRIQESRERREARRQERAEEARRRREEWERFKQTTLVHAGLGVSGGLQHTTSDTVRLERNGLPLLHRAEELAEQMGIPLGRLRWLTYHRRGAAVVHYRRYEIAKKTGGARCISAPLPALAAAQQWLLRNVLQPLAVSPHAHGFVPTRSVVTNAAPHAGKAVVVNLDVRDFFPSITFRRVKGLFGKLGYSEHIATVFALLCTEPPRVAVEHESKVYYVALGDRVLPQGACTSPAITNALCRRLDSRLAGLARRHGFAYTRYADDLTFSGDEPRAAGRLLRSVRSILADEGFTEHEQKTRVMRSARRQEVTGVVVNRRPTIGRREYRELRAILHNAAKHGLESQNRDRRPNFREHLRGRIAWVAMVDPRKGEKLREAFARVS